MPVLLNPTLVAESRLLTRFFYFCSKSRRHCKNSGVTSHVHTEKWKRCTAQNACNLGSNPEILFLFTSILNIIFPKFVTYPSLQFWILNIIFSKFVTYSSKYFTLFYLLSFEKVALPLIKVGKNSCWKRLLGFSVILRWFQNGAELLSKTQEKNFLPEWLIF